MRLLLLVWGGNASTGDAVGMAVAVLAKLYWNVISSGLYPNVKARSTGMS
jgi:hypothetical protein